MNSLIQELRARADARRQQASTELESMRMIRRGGTFMDDYRYIQAITQGRRVRT